MSVHPILGWLTDSLLPLSEMLHRCLHTPESIVLIAGGLLVLSLTLAWQRRLMTPWGMAAVGAVLVAGLASAGWRSVSLARQAADEKRIAAEKAKAIAEANNKRREEIQRWHIIYGPPPLTPLEMRRLSQSRPITPHTPGFHERSLKGVSGPPRGFHGKAGPGTSPAPPVSRPARNMTPPTQSPATQFDTARRSDLNQAVLIYPGCGLPAY